jgi:Bacteriophage baseplate protein W
MANPVQSDPLAQRFLDYPYSVSSTGAPKLTGPDDHLRDLVLQVLFTIPGERVNLPEFGVGVQQLVFAPSNDMLRASAQFLISSNLQRWLGDRIDQIQVGVTSQAGEEEVAVIEISYRLKATEQRQTLQVQV